MNTWSLQQIYKETDRLLLGKGSLFTDIKENATLIKKIVSIYIYFDDYPSYSGAIYDFLETHINSHIQCDHGCPYSTIKTIKGDMLTCINKEIW